MLSSVIMIRRQVVSQNAARTVGCVGGTGDGSARLMMDYCTVYSTVLKEYWTYGRTGSYGRITHMLRKKLRSFMYSYLYITVLYSNGNQMQMVRGRALQYSILSIERLQVHINKGSAIAFE